MKVNKKQRARHGRGNLAAAKAAIESGDGRGVAELLNVWASNRQKAAKERAAK